MALKLLYTNLLRFACDALVIASDESLRVGGSVLGACFSQGGMFLKEQLDDLGHCPVGAARRLNMNRLDLKCRELIITAAPFWQDGQHQETELLAQCYQNSLDEAVRLGCRKIGFSLIDSGAFGFPKEIALETAVQAILAHPKFASLDVYLITFDWRNYGIDENVIAGLAKYVREKLKPDADIFRKPRRAEHALFGKKADLFFREEAAMSAACENAVPLEERLKQLDEGFSQMLLRKIDEAGMKDSECYKKANVSKQLFSRIRSDPHYRPKKETAIAFALALHLDLDETNALLRAAGYSLSHSSKFDVIIEYFIMQRVYNVFAINEALYEYDQPVLGSE